MRTTGWVCRDRLLSNASRYPALQPSRTSHLQHERQLRAVGVARGVEVPAAALDLRGWAVRQKKERKSYARLQVCVRGALIDEDHRWGGPGGARSAPCVLT
jgi:hypothetical protein